MESMSNVDVRRSRLSKAMNILVVSNTHIIRESVAATLRSDTLVADVQTAEPSILAGKLLLTVYDAVLVYLPIPAGPIFVTQLLSTNPDAKVVAFGIDATLSSALRWVQSGALGLVGSSASFVDLAAALEASARGERVCSSDIARLFLSAAAGQFSPRRLLPVAAGEGRLTARETEILAMLVAGNSNKQIAISLDIKLATVKNHVHNLFTKIGVSNRWEAQQFGRVSNASGA
jgi:two-component system, NarL family, nitrate/nitrite response regulator NarL